MIEHNDGIYKGLVEIDDGYKLSINAESSYINVKKSNDIDVILERINDIDRRIKLLEEERFNKIKKAGI